MAAALLIGVLPSPTACHSFPSRSIPRCSSHLPRTTTFTFIPSSRLSLSTIGRGTRRRRCIGTCARRTIAQDDDLSVLTDKLSFSTPSSGNVNGKYIREDYLVKKVSSKELQELLKGNRSVPLIVDFYATWCGPCILMAQDLEMLAVEYESSALFVKVDTDDEYEFARDMQVRGLPTLYFFGPDPNKDAIRTEGLVPREMIKNIIDNEL